MDEGLVTSLVPRVGPGQPPQLAPQRIPDWQAPLGCKPCITPEVPTSLLFLATWPRAQDYIMGSPGTQIVHSQEKFCVFPWMAAPTTLDKTS